MRGLRSVQDGEAQENAPRQRVINIFLRLEGLLWYAAVVSGLDAASLFHFSQKARSMLARFLRIT